MTTPYSAIRAVICDVDGTLCGPLLWYGSEGADAATVERGKFFHVRDGHRMVAARRAGLWVGVCSGRDSQPLRLRARDLGLNPLLCGISDKVAALKAWCAEVDLTPQQVCFVGDDYPDLPLLGQVGLMVTPADADPALRRRADRVCRHPAAGGAVAEVLEWVLQAQGRWPPQEA